MVIITKSEFPILELDGNNPFQLSIESELDTIYPDTIVPFFKGGVEGVFAGIHGIKIHFVSFIQPDINNEKGAIVIASGRTESYIKYKELIFNLFNQNYSIYIMDHRGQGFSERIIKNHPELGHIRKFDYYVKDLKKFVDSYVKPAGHDSLFLLSHSLGGAIATLYLERHWHDFKAAAFVSPMNEPLLLSLTGSKFFCGFWMRFTKFFTAYLPTTGPYDQTLSSFSEDKLTHSKKRFEITLDEYKSNPGVKLGGPSPDWLYQSCKAARKGRRNSFLINVPLVLFQAGEDNSVTRRGQRRFRKNLRKSIQEKSGVFTVRGAYHELFHEGDKYRIPVLTKIISFFNSYSSPQN